MMTAESSQENDYQIDKGCVLIAEAGHLLACNDVTTCKAMLIYHQYQKVTNEYRDYFHLIATAALILSIQVCEEEITTDQVLNIFKSLGMPSKEEVKREIFEQLLDLQFDIYRVVFDRPYREVTTKLIEDELYCETAHKYVFSYLKAISSIPDIQKNLISVQTWTLRLLFTFYHSQRCIIYEALDVALAALCLAFNQYKIDMKQTKTVIKDIFACVAEAKVRNAMDDILLVSDVGTGNAKYGLPE